MGNEAEKSGLFAFEPIPRARSLDSETAGRFGCLLSGENALDADPYLSELVQALRQQLDLADCRLSFIERWEGLIRNDRMSKLLSPQTVDVLVLLHCEHLLDQIKGLIRHVIVVGMRLSDPTVDYVTLDLVESAREATRYLLDLGHRKIAYLGLKFPPDRAWNEREAGYRLALTDHRNQPDARILHVDSLSREDCLRMAKTVLDCPDRPTAVFAQNDMAALAVIEAAKGLGLEVPRDLSVMGFNDDAPARSAHPALTTMRVDKASLARVVAEWGVTRIQNPGVPPKITLIPGELIVRESCAPLV